MSYREWLALAIRCMSAAEKITIGIDPGKSGAVAVVRGREVLLLADLPAPEDAAELLTMLRPYAGSVGCIELMECYGVNAHTALKMGASFGAALGVLIAAGVAATTARACVWKRHFGLFGKGKAGSVARARELFDALPKRMRADKAEALLIAHYAGK